MTKVQLKVKGGAIENFEVEEITVKQFKKAIKILKNIVEEFKGNERIGEFVNFLGDLEKEKTKDDKEKDVEFGVQLAQSFDFLLEEVPEHMVALLSIVSGIEEEVVDNQPVGTLFDIYDAVVTENDIEKLISRGKKSLALTKIRWTFSKNQK